jgi:tetratricopeptide (TPR) repeat protein
VGRQGRDKVLADFFAPDRIELSLKRLEGPDWDILADERRRRGILRRVKRSTATWILRILALQLLVSVNLFADVIYLNNGNILLVEKAWEEGEEVKYQTRSGIQSLPKSSVREIRQQKPAASPAGRRWVRVSPDDEGTKNAPPASAPAVAGAAGGAAISQETLIRLRSNLNADPSDATAKAELVHALNSVASLQVSQGNLASAQSSLEEALRLDRRNPVLLSNLATIDLRSGNYQRAESLLMECLQIDRKEPWIHYLLGETYYRQEKISQAISQWQEGLQLGPNEAISKRLEKAERESGVHKELGALKSVHFILRYDKKASDYALGEQILTVLEDLHRRLSNALISQAPETVAVILYPDQAYFDITRAPGWTGGMFDGKIRIPIRGLRSVTPELKAILAHELTHCFMAALPGRGSPTWFLEGIAQVQEGRSAAKDKKALAQLHQADRLIPLENLKGSFLELPAAEADLAYTESLSAVEYLIGRFGHSAIRELLSLMAQNHHFENAFSTALQRTVPEFENAWQRDLTK